MATETTGRQILIGILIFGAIIAGSFSLISLAIPSTDDSFTTYNDTYNQFADMNTKSKAVAAQIETSTAKGGGITDFIDVLVSSSWGSLTLMWDSVTAFGSVVSNSETGLGVISPPYWFIGSIITIISVILAFAIMAAIFKWHI